MSDLVCIAFKDSGRADRELNELRAMQSEYVLDLEDAAVVVRDQDGKVHLKQCVDVFGGATTHGVALGMFMGMVNGFALHESPCWPIWQHRRRRRSRSYDRGCQ